MAGDSMRVRVPLGRLDLLEVLVDEPDQLEVKIASWVKWLG